MPWTADRGAARDQNLTGRSAAGFLAFLGWQLTSSLNGFHVFGDRLGNGDFTVARYWHTSAEFDFLAETDSRDPGQLIFIVGLEGEMTYVFEDHEHVVSPGRVMVARPDAYMRSRCTHPVAVIYLRMSIQFLAENVTVAAGKGSPEYLPMLISIANSLLNQESRPVDAGFVRVARAIEELALAVAAESDLSYVSRSSEDARLGTYSRAITLMAAEAVDPRVTVDSIAQRLGVSRSHLFAVFKAEGETPATYLRRVRITLARSHLEAGDAERIAAYRSGFGSVRRMRDALAQDVA